MKLSRPFTAVAAGVALTLTLAACGGASEPMPGSAAPSATAEASADAADPTVHNDADTAFAQMMVLHHEGAIEMAELAVQKAETDEVKALGERIASAQGPEIEQMTSWLEVWGEPGPQDAEMGSMDHGGMDMEGMSQEEVMAELTGLSGPEFDSRFLALMADHHRGAIEMAEAHLSEGENPEARALSQQIIDAQSAEIAEMTTLLDSLR